MRACAPGEYRDRAVKESRLEAPYKGLAPFTAEEAHYFFGRDLERNLLGAHIRGHRLTVLYGASGAGKSSLLQAGLAAQFRLIAAENRGRQRRPGMAVAVVSSWEREPQRVILSAASSAVADALGVAQLEPAPDDNRFIETLQQWTERLDGTLILLLDQFEDYLAIRRRSRTELRFDTELAQLVEAPGTRVHVLISVQEESLARLDFLENHVLDWFARALRLEHLTASSMEQAIVRPLQAWNEMRGLASEESYEAEGALVAALLEQSGNDGEPIATAYLQLVLRRLWDEETKMRSRVLRKSTLDTLGGIATIVANHVGTALSRLSEGERLRAARILRKLVTPAGSRESLSVEELDDPEAAQTFRLLADSSVRIVRPVSGTGRTMRYDVFHQALVSPILDWLAALDAEQRQRERRKSRRRAAAIIAVGVLAVVAMIAAIALRRWYRLEEQREEAARAGILLQQAEILRDRQFDLALLLAVYAHDHGAAADAQRFLGQNLQSSRAHGAFIGWLEAAVVSLNLNHDDAKVIAADAKGNLQTWSRRGHNAPPPPQRLDWGAATDVTFSRDGTTVAIVAPDGTARLRSMIDSLFPITSFSTPAASALALNFDASVLAVGDSKGFVAVYRQPFGAAATRFAAANVPVEAMDFGPDGQTLVIATADGGVQLVSLSSARPPTRLAALRDAVCCVAFSPARSKMIAAGGSDGTLHLWSGSGDEWSHRSLQTNGGKIRSIAFSADGEFVAAGGENGVIGVWRPLSAPEPATASFTGHNDPVRSIAFARDGSLISGQEDGSVRVWPSLAQHIGAGALTDFASMRGRACQVANRNLSKNEWLRYIGADMNYTRVCVDLPAGTGVDDSR